MSNAILKLGTGTDLARLSSSQEQHLDFILRHHTVPLELVLNLVIAWLEKVSGREEDVGAIGGGIDVLEGGYLRALASSSMPEDWTQPIVDRWSGEGREKSGRELGRLRSQLAWWKKREEEEDEDADWASGKSSASSVSR